MVDAELAATNSEDDGSLRKFLDEVSVVVAAAFETIAATNQEETSDVALLDFF